MAKRIESIQSVDTETGEVLQIPAVRNGVLYDIYSVVSNKTVREHEHLMVRWWNKNKAIPGREMIKTNRGWFLDGWNIDEKSTQKWFNLTGNDRSLRPNPKKKWNFQKPLKKR